VDFPVTIHHTYFRLTMGGLTADINRTEEVMRYMNKFRVKSLHLRIGENSSKLKN